MVRVGLAAPHFDASAVVGTQLVPLSWQQLHEEKALILLFDPRDGTADSPEYPLAVSNAVMRLAQPHGKVAYVWRGDPAETLAWARLPRAEGGPGALAFPLLADSDGRIAALYGLADTGQPSIWGEFLIDPAGILRQMRIGSFPAWAGVDELLRIIHASTSQAHANL